MPDSELISDQLEVVLEKPSISLKLLFVILEFSLLQLLDRWDKLLFHHLWYFTQEELMRFQRSNDSLLNGLHHLSQFRLVPDEGSTGTFRNLLRGELERKILQGLIEDPC